MMDAALAQAFEATWPAVEYADAGGFRVGKGLGAGGRVSSARALTGWKDSDIPEAVKVHEGWGQRPLFRALDEDVELVAALEAQGFRRENPTAIMEIETAALTDRDLPRVTAFAVWPPMAIQREIWGAGNIGPARQAVMERVEAPVTSILGRIADRAAGAAFAAIHQGVAMVHCVEILTGLRRKGLAGWMMRQAAFWAADNGAERIGLAVSRDNEGAMALYRHLGFREMAGYSYYARPAG